MTVEELPEHLKATLGEHPSQARGRKLSTKPGEAGRDTEAKRRGKIDRDSNGTRSANPTGDTPGTQHRMYEPRFSQHSYGFQTADRSAHDAVKAARGYIECGEYRWVVDIDLAKFFDTVNHDRLMARMKANMISDKRVLRLVNEYLKAGVMVNGVVMENRRRHTARRAVVATTIQYRPGRIRPGTGETRTSLCALR